MLSIEVEIRPIGKESIHGDQHEMREELLFDATLGLGVKILNDKHALADFIELFHAPASMVDLHEILDGISLMEIEERRAQAERTA